MPKELIVSVNGREKKIAIVEDGRVTEFYIERGEASQGIVGNIYKGRVMRVLPGMQSAFVDIGLDRDAFLYVSDFFDEEEEYERIVVDKTKSEGADAESAARAASERIERARIERERAMEEAQEHAEPEGEEAGDDGEEAAADSRMVETSPAAQDAGPSPQQRQEQRAEGDEETDAGGRGRQRRRRGGREREDSRGERGGVAADTGRRGADAEASRPRGVAPEDVATPFSVGAASFERVVDEEAAAAEEGSMFKDARLQERLTDQVRGVEFDLDDTTATAEVGSLLPSVGSGGSSFQRIDDGDDDAPTPQSRRSVRPAAAASVSRLVDELDDEGGGAAASAGARSFERVSDDEGGAESSAGSAGAATTGARKGRAAAKKSAAKKSAKKGAASAETAAEEGASKKSAKKSAGAKSAAKKSPAASKKAAGTKGGARGKKSGGAEGLAEGDREARKEAKNTDGEGSFDDAQASVKSPGSRGEFARRGGRRRRRGGAADGTGEERPDGNGEDAEGLNADAAAPEVEAQEAAPVAETRPAAPAQEQRPASGGGRGRGGRRDEGGGRRDEGGGRREEGGREGRDTRDARGGREGRDARGGPRGDRTEGRGERSEQRGDGRGDGRGDNRGGGPANGGGGGRDRGRERGGRERGRGGQPMITDLLREGQEIIVQIAKEPIAQKGARITSHIALPGRFLVYMPTVDHVGVSRKIESDQERVRLRKLIQKIVAEEDVPSGGFIVRTAGVGISEQDLRDDARYLIRTWRDIRRNAEKQKAPSMAHKDLDLVQRILRDQLSDDFTAIRLDNEEEYTDVVEFVNRIQPRLVNRVKLYTRETPILEAYGVDAEIEKAIKPRVWLKSGGYLVINQTEALVAIDVNTGKFVGRGGSRLEDTITRTNLEAVDEIARQIRLRDLGGILVLDLIDMEERRNRARVMQALQDALRQDKSPTKVLSFNDFGLVIMTRKRVKQSLERTLCSPCPYCQGAGLVKSPQTVCYEILEEARHLARSLDGDDVKQTTLRINTEVARALHTTERDVLREIEDYLGAVDITSEEHIHQEQFDFAFI